MRKLTKNKTRREQVLKKRRMIRTSNCFSSSSPEKEEGNMNAFYLSEYPWKMAWNYSQTCFFSFCLFFSRTRVSLSQNQFLSLSLSSSLSSSLLSAMFLLSLCWEESLSISLVLHSHPRVNTSSWFKIASLLQSAQRRIPFAKRQSSGIIVKTVQ